MRISSKLYFFTFGFCIFIMLMSLLLETNVISNLQHYIIDSNYRNEIMNYYQNNHFLFCLFTLIADTWNGFDWKYDFIMIWATNLFQIILPFFAILGSIQFKNVNTKKEIFRNSWNLASTIFLAYLIFYVIILLICNGNHTDYINRELFSDILGKKFYPNFEWIYFLIEGILRFLFAPFLYCSFGIFFGKMIKNEWLYFDLILFYFGLSFLSSLLAYILGEYIIYVSPLTIMIASSYHDISTIPLLSFNILLFFTSMWLWNRKGKNQDET